MDVVGLIAVPNWVIYVLLFLVGSYFYLTWNYGYFKARGIPHPKPKLFIGNFDKINTLGFHKQVVKWVKEHGKVMGFYEMRRPCLLLADINMIKQVLVKEFSTFTNRRKAPFMGGVKFVSIIRDHDWRRIRNLLTPTFTSGKMRQMNESIITVGDEFIEKIDKAAQDGKALEMKSACVSYVIDVIAAVAFGLKTNCQQNESDQFNVEAKKLTQAFVASPLYIIMVLLPPLVPILDYLGASLFPKSSMTFFRKVIRSALALRKQETNNTKTDFLKLMIEANSSELDEEAKRDLIDSGLSTEKPRKGLSDEEMLSQSLLFFVAGNDTTASTMSFLMYVLATEPHVQQKAYEEVREILTANPTPTYENVQKMTYLEMCINETLRLYSPVAMVDREAGRDITIDGVRIEKGMLVHIAIAALHRDPDAWPEPWRFIPERFTPEAMAARDPLYFLPFGYGPRNCLGLRFAQMEMKMAISKLIYKFKIVPSDETDIPLQFAPGIFMAAKDGIKLKFEKRT